MAGLWSAAMRRQAPPLEAIEAFIIATRSSSFRDAADRLALSPSAFSRRIQALEAFVGAQLFVREGGKVALSRTGERYLRTVEPALDAIRRATVDLQAERGGAALRVVVPQSFAMGWLIPHLPALQRSHPDLTIELRVGRTVAPLRRGHADIAIVAGPGGTEGLPAQRLARLPGTLVTAPRLACGAEPPATLGDLAAMPRLAVYQPGEMWEHWLRAVGFDARALAPPTYYETHFLMIAAAEAGLGVALTPPLLVERAVADGRLVVPLALSAPLGVDYVLVFADEALRRRPDVRRFAAWIAEGLAPHDRA